MGHGVESAWRKKGVTWRYMYHWWPKNSGHPFTTVYLRKDDDGPGGNTHTARVEMSPDRFTASDLDKTTFRSDAHASHYFA